MSLTDLFKHAITIHRLVEAADDEHGNPTSSFAVRAVTVGFMQPVGGRELRAQGEVVLYDWRVGLFAAETIGTADRITWEERIFDVTTILERQGPGFEHHKTVLLKEVEGGPVEEAS